MNKKVSLILCPTFLIVSTLVSCNRVSYDGLKVSLVDESKTFKMGETINRSDFKVLALYSNNTTKEINDWTSPEFGDSQTYTFKDSEDKTFNFSYNNKSATYVLTNIIFDGIVNEDEFKSSINYLFEDNETRNYQIDCYDYILGEENVSTSSLLCTNKLSKFINTYKRKTFFSYFDNYYYVYEQDIYGEEYYYFSSFLKENDPVASYLYGVPFLKDYISKFNQLKFNKEKCYYEIEEKTQVSTYNCDCHTTFKLNKKKQLENVDVYYKFEGETEYSLAYKYNFIKYGEIVIDDVPSKVENFITGEISEDKKSFSKKANLEFTVDYAFFVDASQLESLTGKDYKFYITIDGTDKKTFPTKKGLEDSYVSKNGELLGSGSDYTVNLENKTISIDYKKIDKESIYVIYVSDLDFEPGGTEEEPVYDPVPVTFHFESV